MHSARLVGKQEVILVRISASSRGPQTGSGDINGDFPQEDFWPGIEFRLVRESTTIPRRAANPLGPRRDAATSLAYLVVEAQNSKYLSRYARAVNGFPRGWT
jgi:hypothetical protein